MHKIKEDPIKCIKILLTLYLISTIIVGIYEMIKYYSPDFGIQFIYLTPIITLIIPAILLFIHFHNFNINKTQSVLISSYALLTIPSLLSFRDEYFSYHALLRDTTLEDVMQYGSQWIYENLYIMICSGIIFLLIIFLIIDAFTKFRFYKLSKVIVLILTLFTVLSTTLSLIIFETTPRLVSKSIHDYIPLSLYIALIIFFFFAINRPNESSNISHEKKLEILKEKYELGEITEEIYTKEKNKILNKL